MKPLSAILFLIILGIITYLPSFSGQLYWDDKDFITKNQYVKEFRLDKFWTAQAVEGAGKVSNYFRPIQFTLYSITYKLFGLPAVAAPSAKVATEAESAKAGPSAFAFHAESIFLHIGAAIAVYLFFLKLFQHLRSSLIIDHCALIIAILFLVHPVQTEAVSYVSGMSDPLVALFGFLSLFYFLKFLQHLNRHSGKLSETKRVQNQKLDSGVAIAPQNDKLHITMYIFSLFFFLLSLLSKESGIIFSGIIGLLSLISPIKKQTLISHLSSLTSHLSPLFPFLLLTLLYLLFHQRIDVVDMRTLWGNHPYTNSVLIRLITFLSLLPTYVGILLFPKDLFYERDFTITIPTSVWYLPGFIVLFLLTTFFFLLIWEYRKNLSSRAPRSFSEVEVFLFLSFFVSFIPFSGLVLINGTMYEHFLYIPMIFFFAFILVLAIQQYNNKVMKHSTVVLGAGMVIACLLIIRSYVRQYSWLDPIRLYTQTLKHAPTSFRVRNNLAMAYQEHGMLEEAKEEYGKVIALGPNIPNPYHNLGNLYFEKGDLKTAETYFQKAIAVDPNFGYSYAALVKLYTQTGEKEKLTQISKEITKRFSNK